MPLFPLFQPTVLDINLEGLLCHSAAYDLLESAIAVCDVRGEIRYANQAFSSFNLAVRDKPGNFNYGALMECPDCADWLQRAVSSGGVHAFTRTFCYANSLITVDLSVCAQTLVNAEGEKQGCLLTIGEESIGFGQRHLAQSQESNRNLVERIKVLSREKLTNDRLIRLLLKEAPFAMVLMDESRKVIQANRAAEKLFKISATEMIGQSCERFFPCYAECSCCPPIELERHIEAVEIKGMTAHRESLPLLRSVSVVNNDSGVILIEAFVDLSEIKAAEQMINDLAFYDHLTELPNRRLLQERLHQAFSLCERSGKGGAILFLDLDNFKTINDTFGHDIGDLLLQQVAERLTACIRETDTVARLGGDEFVVLLEDLSSDMLQAAAQTESIGEKILSALQQPYQLAMHRYNSTASIGAALFGNQHEASDELFRQADIAMYQAKKAGRNTLCFFDPKMQEAINAHATLEGELRKALDSRQFQLHYQLQVDSAQRPLGAEVLIRWMHPERGLLFPAQFVALAEETGLILSLGQWVLEATCMQLKAWQHDALTCDMILAVNVSARQFNQVDFVAQVRAIVQRHGINPMRLKLELTESLFLENVENVIATMNALKEIGVQFSLDDFGTGYSSLQYLKRLPLDQIKIDQSFVRDIIVDCSDKAIVSTIIAMAHSMNLNVIAEGVETEDQRQLLLASGCTCYQGYLFGKPMSIELFEALLKQGETLL